MSRLDRAIDRFAAQRAFLGRAAELVDAIPGPVLEIGLGKGRTFDHLRGLLPEREIFVFDHHVHAPADCVPDDDHLFLGDFRESLATAAARLSDRAVLAHADIGSEKPLRDAELAAALAPLIDALMAPDAIVVADRELAAARWTPIEAPEEPGRFPYFMYRVGRYSRARYL
ncbi:MAG: class I SAM-dependent methyltransferase [Alphaproteobacteria bacterium]